METDSLRFNGNGMKPAEHRAMAALGEALDTVSDGWLHSPVEAKSNSPLHTAAAAILTEMQAVLEQIKERHAAGN
jgi:hypothetical protein